MLELYLLIERLKLKYFNWEKSDLILLKWSDLKIFNFFFV